MNTKMRKTSSVCLLAAGLVLVGCEGMGPKQTGGTIIGGAGGALLGSTIGSGSGQVVAVGVGAVLGALLGGYVGQEMDANDRRLAHGNAVVALDRGVEANSHTWRNPKTGRYGDSTVLSTSPDGSCRTMQSVTYNNQGREIGREIETYCRDKAGNWIRG